MSLRTTGILALVLVALAAILFVYEFEDKGDPYQLDQESRRLVRFDPASASRIVLSRSDTTVVMENSEDGWVLREPVNDAGDAGTIEGLLRALEALGHRGVAAEDVLSLRHRQILRPKMPARALGQGPPPPLQAQGRRV